MPIPTTTSTLPLPSGPKVNRSSIVWGWQSPAGIGMTEIDREERRKKVTKECMASQKSQLTGDER